MRKWLVLFLLFLVGCSQSDANFLMTSQSGSPPAWLLDETFESSGYDDADWVETKSGSSTVNEDFSSSGLSMEGSYVCSLFFDWYGDACRTINTLASSYTDLYGEFMFRYEGTESSDAEILAVYSSASVKLAIIWISNNKLRCSDGTVDDTSDIAIAADTTYYVWWWYSQGTGANSDFEVYVSTNTTKPGSTVLDISDGSSTGTGNKIYLGWETGTPTPGNTIYFDHVQVYNDNTVWTAW